VELVSLSDEETTLVTPTSEKLERWTAKLDAMLASIAAGRIPARPEAVLCARCPHLFACGAVPEGPLDLR
jgi:hypothetical protein